MALFNIDPAILQNMESFRLHLLSVVNQPAGQGAEISWGIFALILVFIVLMGSQVK